MKHRQGFLLVTVLFVVVVVSLLALGTSFTALIDRQVASRQRGGTEAYYVAHAGMDRLKTAVFLGLSDFLRSNVDFCGVPDLRIDLGGGLTLDQGVLSTAFPIDAGGNGWYKLQFERSGPYYILTAVGYIAATADVVERAAQATIQLVAAAGEGPAGVWDNAIFARRLSKGESGDLTGTIAAYGSVHIVNGDITLDSDESLAASGSSGIFNNYFGRGQQTNVRNAASAALGEARSNHFDLCSRLKIAQGSVRVQSNAVGIGATGDVLDDDGVWVSADSSLNRVQSIEGVYLGRGSVVDQNGEPLTDESKRQIYSRSGVAGYDGFDLPFPALPIGFPVIGDEQDCLLVDQGVLRIPPLVEGSVTCTQRSGAEDEASLAWDEDRQVLVVNGRMSFPDARLSIERRSGPNPVSSLRYEGMGELQIGSKAESVSGEVVRAGQIDISIPVLPSVASDNYVSTAFALTTAGDVNIAGITGNNPALSVLLYAEGTVNVRQQVNIVGSVVANSVVVEQVPGFLYHPHVGLAAEALCLVGTVCDLGTTGNRAPWSEVSIEVR